MPSDPRESTRVPRGLIAPAIDVLLFVASAVVILVGLAGGWAFTTGGVLISVKSTTNPVIFLAVLACIRYVWFSSIPVLGATRWRPADLDAAADRVLARIGPGHHGARVRTRTVLVVTLVTSTLLRLVNAWAHPGFTTGDDVEIHELTLGRLFGSSWDIWHLRSAFYPLVFVYPAQALAQIFAGHDVPYLVFAGRLPVVAAATVAIWLVYRVTLSLTGHSTAAALAAIFLASSRLHLWFGSTELPRPLASAFVLAAFWALLNGRGPRRATTAGLLLGVGGALRFGELVFFAPALMHLALERRWHDVLVMGVAGAVAAGLCLGLSDWLYWGRPFFSLLNIVDYTLIQRASSRGFQPFWYYVRPGTDWTNVVFLAYGLFAIRAADRRVALWTWVPLMLLSLLPHKEARYAIAVLPFLCIGVAQSLITLGRFPVRRVVKTIAVWAVALAVVFELSNWRFARSDDAVRLAQQIDSLRPSGVAAQQIWRFGGRLYFEHVNGPLVDIREPIVPAQVAAENVEIVVVQRRSATTELRQALGNRGYRSEQALSTSRYVTFAQP